MKKIIFYIIILCLIMSCSTNSKINSMEISSSEEIVQSKKVIISTNHSNNEMNDLDMAVRAGEVDLVKEILSQDPTRIDERMTFLEETPLMIACQYVQYNVVQYLLENGASVNLYDTDGMTPLLTSLTFPDWDYDIRKEIFLLLISYGAEINVQNRANWTPLMVAVNVEDLELVKLLINMGAEIDMRNDADDTALSLAQEKGKEEIIQILIENGAVE